MKECCKYKYVFRSGHMTSSDRCCSSLDLNGCVLTFRNSWCDFRYITARYTTSDGKKHQSLLLLSGWWGFSRHFHYIPEISAAFFWSCGAGFTHFLPFFYTVYLTILLVDRSVRDDSRCRSKVDATLLDFLLARWPVVVTA